MLGNRGNRKNASLLLSLLCFDESLSLSGCVFIAFPEVSMKKSIGVFQMKAKKKKATQKGMLNFAYKNTQ